MFKKNMSKNFMDYNFNEKINQLLNNKNFIQPTEIQSQVIPKLRNKQNLVGVSMTGSGKTHAFLLPIFENINSKLKKPQAIIMVPTRELAMQLYANILEFQKIDSDYKVDLLIGGKNFDESKIIDSQIVVGTPGRIFDAISKRHILKLDMVEYVILDEADMIFDENFIEETDNVMSYFKDSVCFALFSATITKNMHPFIKKYFDNMQIIEVSNSVNDNVEHYVVNAKGKDKYQTLLELTNIIKPYLCIIFASKKEDVEKLYYKLNEDGLKCAILHGDLTARQRSQTLKRINDLEYNFVVASDIVARGIDIDGVSHIISYDLPYELEYYLHRAGRTGRYQYVGYSYLIYENSDERSLHKLESKGLTFNFLEIKDGELVEAGFRTRDQKSKKDNHYDVNQVSRLTKKKQPVKPNYKKKRKIALEKIKKQEKQNEIKQRIRAQRKKRKTS